LLIRWVVLKIIEICFSLIATTYLSYKGHDPWHIL
jgi:hypothetical protein